MTTPTLHLYTDAQYASPYAMSVFVALHEKGLAFELSTVDLGKSENQKPEFAAKSLTRRVPTLIHDGFALSESSAITEYLDETFPGVALYPADRQQRARARQVQAWLRSDLMPIRQERSTEVVFYGPTTAPLSGAAQLAAEKLFAMAEAQMCDILGVGMFDSCEIRVHPDGSAIARMGTITQGQGHQTTYAQIIASEAGIPASKITVEEGDTATAPYGLGTYGSRSTPVAGAAVARASRKIREKARRIAAHLLEASPDDVEFDLDRFVLKGSPDQFKTVKEVAWAAYNNVPEGLEMGLEAVDYYDPPNFTFPFGAYVCVLDVNRYTGEIRVRRFYALDDCGTRINPMIIEGQIHGGLTEGFAVALGQELPYDEAGNLLGATLLDYFVPTAVETPHWHESSCPLGSVVTPFPLQP